MVYDATDTRKQRYR